MKSLSISATSSCVILNWMVLFSYVYSNSLKTSQSAIYYVSGNGSRKFKDCDHQTSPCTLPTVVDKVQKSAVFIILDNPFVLSEEIELSSRTNITITGADKDMVVQCQGNAGFILQGCTNCSFTGLHFVDCQVNVSSFIDRNEAGLRLSLSSNLSTIFVLESTNFEILNCTFHSCLDSAILLVDVNGTTTIEGSTFSGNKNCLSAHDLRSGGIVMRHTPRHSYNSTVQLISCDFDGNINISPNFSHPGCNNYDHGGAMDVVISANEIQIYIIILGSNFRNNSACSGGAVGVIYYGKDAHVSASINSSLFENNTGHFSGGAVAISYYKVDIGNDKHPLLGELTSYGEFSIQSCNFQENSASWSGALAAFSVSCDRCRNNMDIKIADTNLTNNKANQSAFAIGLSGESDPHEVINYNITLTFAGSCTLYSNQFKNDYSSIGAISVESAVVVFGGGGVTMFDSNVGTALILRSSSQAVFDGNVIFRNNIGVLGGAILVQSESKVLIKANSCVHFINNRAFVYGGAIYSTASSDSMCVVEFDSEVFPNNTRVFFINNTAPGLNQSVFIETSKPCEEHINTILAVFKFEPRDPYQILFPPDKIKLEILPQPSHGGIPEFILGESFYMNTTLISDIFNTASIGVGHMYYDQKGSLDEILEIQGPKTINFDEFTQHINYSVIGPEVTSAINISIMFFFLKQSSYHVGINTVEISIVSCRPGYTYSSVQRKCVCVGLEEVRCLQDSRQLCLKYHYWYSSDFKSVHSCPMVNCQYLYMQCPPNTRKCHNSTDYCMIENSSDVCWEGRAGILCSECRDGRSFSLGAYQCVDTNTTCNSKNTFLLIMLVLLYWVLYAAALLVILSLQLSVGSGFMYGIVYYFSVVTIYTSDSALFGDLWVFVVVTVCEALTQLTCFKLIAMMLPYCFSSSWTTPLPHILFQYAGPAFVIALMITAILVSHYCRLPKKLRLSRSSPIHAICLLVLFSYTSISSTNFQLLLPTTRSIGNQVRVKVAPSVSYFSAPHIPYALIAIFVEFTISLPICFLLLFAPCISKHIDLVKYKLKPIVDEFHACYRTECRWFAGFYFLARQLVYLVNGVFSETEPQGNTLLVVLNVLIWTIHTTFQPYRKKWLNVLDTILLTDLVLISSSVAGQSVDLRHPFNIFIHRRVFPYVLILFPLCYLVGAVVVIFVQKLGISRRLSCLWDKFYWENRSGTAATNNEGSQTNVKAKWDDSYYGDDGVREPLLDESFRPGSITPSKHIHYESTTEGSNRSHTQSSKDTMTTSSIRVSQMGSFPPQEN